VTDTPHLSVSLKIGQSVSQSKINRFPVKNSKFRKSSRKSWSQNFPKLKNSSHREPKDSIE